MSGHGQTAARRRVILADDDVLLREGLAVLLTRHGFEVMGQAGDGTRLMELVQEHASDLDVVIVDIRMPPSGATEGLIAALKIRESFPSVAILVLSADIEFGHAMALLSSGDRIGYLLKSRVAEVAELTDVLERLCEGGSAIDPSLVHELYAAGAQHLAAALSTSFGLPSAASGNVRPVLSVCDTPVGAGAGREPELLWMRPGDVCEVEIEGIGTLCNPISEEDSDGPGPRPPTH
jgi:DNA-binding NarL/FixJ family response regulator